MFPRRSLKSISRRDRQEYWLIDLAIFVWHLSLCGCRKDPPRFRLFPVNGRRDFGFLERDFDISALVQKFRRRWQRYFPALAIFPFARGIRNSSWTWPVFCPAVSLGIPAAHRQYFYTRCNDLSRGGRGVGEGGGKKLIERKCHHRRGALRRFRRDFLRNRSHLFSPVHFSHKESRRPGPSSRGQILLFEET